MSKEKTKLSKCTLADMCFPVRLLTEKMNCNKEYSKFVVGLVDGSLKKLNQMSDVYSLVACKEIFPEIEKIFNEFNMKFNVEYSELNNVKFYGDYILEDSSLNYVMKGTNDVIRPILRINHSYNGTSRYSFIFGYFRLVCSNGLVIPVEEMKEFNLSIRGKHTKDSIVTDLEKLKSTLEYFVRNYKTINNAITEKYEILGKRTITDAPERIEQILEACSINAITTSKFNTVNYVMAKISEEANSTSLGYGGRITDWLIYNAINQYLNDSDRNIMSPVVRAEKDKKVFEYMLKNAPIAVAI